MHDGSTKERFTKFFESENDAVFRYCFWRTSDRELAIELTQETFTRFWKELVSGKDIPNPRAFVFLVAKRLVIDWYRKEKTVSLDIEYEDESGPIFEPQDERATLEIELFSDISRVMAYLDTIEERCREVMYLRFVEDVPPREIAEMLGLTPNAVSVRLTKGVAALRKVLGLTQ